MTISLAQPADHHHLAGVVIYRYRHGWILINPGVPSRGKHAGAHAAIIHHKSGGTTVGHFTHGNVGGHGPTHAKFVVDKNLAPNEDYAPHLKAAMKAGFVEPNFGEKDAAEAQLDKQHAENLSKLSAVAQDADANAQDIYATSYHHAAAAEAFTAYAAEAGDTKEGQQALLKASIHKNAQIKKLSILASDAHLKAGEENTSTAHQHAVDAYSELIDAAGPDHPSSIAAAKYMLKHQKAKLETPGAKHVQTKEYLDAVSASAKAEETNHVQDHIDAMKANVTASNAAHKSGATAWTKGHMQAANEHAAKAKELKAHLDSLGDPFGASDHDKAADIEHMDALKQKMNSPQSTVDDDDAFITAGKKFQADYGQSYSDAKSATLKPSPVVKSASLSNYDELKNWATEASAKANQSGNLNDHVEAQLLHKHASVAAGKHGDASAEEAHADVSFLHGEMAKGKTMGEAATTLVSHKNKASEPVTANDLKGLSGAEEDEMMAKLFKQMQAANAGTDEAAKTSATKEMLKANTQYEINHNELWHSGDSVAMGTAKPTGGITMTGYKANDSAAINNLYDPYGSPEDQTAAYKASLVSWKRKYGNDWSPQVAQQSKAPDLGPTMSTPNQTAEFADAEAAGFKHVSEDQNINAGWDVPSDFRYDEEGVYGYTTNDYISINAQLRNYSATGGSNDDRIAQMDAQFAAMPPLTYGVVTTRRLSGDGPFGSNPPGMKPGDVTMDPGFGSTTKNPDYFFGNTVIEVRTPAGMKIMDLNHTVKSSAPSEAEALLPRGTAYRVVTDYQSSQGRKIVVEVVSQDGTVPGK